MKEKLKNLLRNLCLRNFSSLAQYTFGFRNTCASKFICPLLFLVINGNWSAVYVVGRYVGLGDMLEVCFSFLTDHRYPQCRAQSPLPFGFRAVLHHRVALTQNLCSY